MIFNSLSLSSSMAPPKKFCNPLSDILNMVLTESQILNITLTGVKTVKKSLGLETFTKPVASLNWDFKINDNTTLSSVLRFLGRGGGTEYRKTPFSYKQLMV
jgi:hypothetical protein